MKRRIEFHLIHGFLGAPSDWQNWVTLVESACPAGVQISFVFYHLFSPSSSPWIIAEGRNGLWDLAKRINFSLEPLGQAESSWPGAKRPLTRILMGYSLGGRMGLHLLLDRPEFWSGAVILSAHPGLLKDSQRAERLAADQRWAERFDAGGEGWESLLRAWNAQAVFEGESEPRLEKDFDRTLLARVMRECSLGTQEDLRPRLKRSEHSILWVYGERDPKFLPFGKEMEALNPRFESCSLPGVGHRVLQQSLSHRDCQKMIGDFLSRFINLD